MPNITGTFEVKMIPQPGPEPADGVALQRLSGRMDIRIEGGQHFYDFEYSLQAG